MTDHRVKALASALALIALFAPVAAHASVPATVSATGDAFVYPSDTIDPTLPPPTPDPVIVVRRYQTTPERLLVGDVFTLELELYNATTRTAKNTYVALGASAETPMEGAAATTGSGLVVIGTSNVRFLGTLPGKDSDTVTFKLLADPRGGPGVYSLPVTVSYEHNGVRANFSQTIGLVLNRDASFAVVSSQVPESGVVGEPFKVSIEAANQGLFAVGGVTLSLESTGATLADAFVQIGSMEAGASEFIDATVTPTGSGPIDLYFVVRYRDDLNQPKEFRTMYTVDVSAEPVPENGLPADGDTTPREGPGGFLGLLLALLGLGH